MPSSVDIATPERMRRLGRTWFVMPLILVGVWLVASPHHAGNPAHLAATGVAAKRCSGFPPPVTFRETIP